MCAILPQYKDARQACIKALFHKYLDANMQIKVADLPAIRRELDCVWSENQGQEIKYQTDKVR